ncbi:uncharacterized protein Dana_GF19086 [Drosophila ananassae]|uniref:Complement component 1 Q subcomponent-binding protein, mitochondrial n=1 Tax=Drosophila ananassae TaxID=7217 RepID=B3MZP7_DROAN|nr:complement component 1 Q subcomponent-binding protein, mitochondrial [Drosophila ananassae]EDV33848.1 uncharacterized protein Dana_GF19086 [Drosophila ananassae]
MSRFLRVFRPLPRALALAIRNSRLGGGSDLSAALVGYEGASSTGRRTAVYSLTSRRSITTGSWHGQKVTRKPLAELKQQEQEQEQDRKDHQSLSLNQNQVEVSPSDRHLVEFLTGEIIEERRVQLQLNAPLLVDDYVAIFRGSEVELVKTTPTERVNIFFNVSKSVPRRVDDTATPVRSVPKFEVLIKRGDALLSIYCHFSRTAFKDGKVVKPKPNQKWPDIFFIQEMSLYEHAWNECSYTIEASLIDDNLYCLIMEMLAEKGITNEFAVKVSDLATAHEHASYIDFLENLSKFAVGLPPPLGGDDGGTK